MPEASVPRANERAPFAPAADSGLSALRAITLNHRNLGFDGLQALAFDCHQAAALHDTLTAAGIESFVLVTCNRTEIVWRTRGPQDDGLVERASADAGAVEPPVWDAATRLSGAGVAWHLFRVCAGLESLVRGEAEILGQVRAALDACTGAGPFLRGVTQAALRAGRMARSETSIGVGARSVASAAVHIVATSLPLGSARVLVLGAGATGLKVATHLRAFGVTHLVVANRSVERARTMAAAVGADAIGLDGVADELTRVDAVLCAVHAPTPLVRLADLAAVSTARRQRPLLVADISMPPAVEPGPVPGVTRVDLAAIERFVHQQQDRRAAEVPQVEAILAREMAHLETWVRRHALRPLVSGLRRKVEAIRRAELARVHGELGERAVDAAVLDRLSRRLLEQVLAVPLATLETGALPLDQAQTEYLCRLFALDREAAS